MHHDDPFDFDRLQEAFQAFLEFMQTNEEALIFAVAFAATAYGLKKWGKKLFHRLRLWVTQHKARKIKLPKHLIPDQNGWFQAELELCAKYYHRYMQARTDLSLYDKAQGYLRKCHELGRAPAPLWAKFVVSGLTLAESIVFGMVVAELGMDSITPEMQPTIAGLIGLTLATVLMLMTHFAGTEWHNNELIDKVGKMARERLRNGQTTGASDLTRNTKVSLANDGEDDDQSPAQQLLNRITTNYNLTPDWRGMQFTLMFITGLLVLAFLARLSVTDLVETAYAAEPLFSAELDDLGLAGELGLGNDDDSGGGWLATGKISTLMIFSLLFAGIQALSIYLGKTFGFAGKEARKAYQTIKSFATREAYINTKQARQVEIQNTAQTELNRLQQAIIEKLSAEGVDAEAFAAAKRSGERTFLAYTQARTHEEKTREYEDF